MRRLRTEMAGAGALWLLSRLALMGFMLFAAWTLSFQPERRLQDGFQWALDRFWGGDTGHFARIAEQGYPKNTCCDQAFMPGYPLAVRAMSVFTGGDYRLAATLATAVFGVLMAAVLWWLAHDQIKERTPDDARAGGFRAVTYLMVAPYGVFFVVGYSEAMFMTVAVGSWLAGRKGHWWLAGLLGAAAVAIRVNGLFLVAALGIMYLLQLRNSPEERRWRPRWDILAFTFPVVALAAIAAVLHHSTGSWNAWQEAEEKGWDRQTAWPWQGMVDGWHEVTTHRGPHLFTASLAAFLTVVLGIVLLGVLAYLRRWPEFTFMLLNVLVLVCSTTFVSAPRYGLTWFPAYILVAELTGRTRWRWLHPVLIITCLPLLAGLSLLYSRQAWVA